MPHSLTLQKTWLALVTAGLTWFAQAATAGQAPAQQTNRSPRGMFRLPKPGVCPLPILPALPRYTDTHFFAKTDVPHGRVEQATYTNAAGEEKRFHVYLPPDYDRTTNAYPVLYLNHGGGDEDFILNVSQRVHTSLTEMKVPHTWHLESGGHTWEVWKNDLYLLAQQLFR